MKKVQGTDSWVDEVMSSLDGIERPAANPFLYEKIKYRMEGAKGVTAQYGQPRLLGWAIAVLLIIAFNGFSIINKIQAEKHILHTELYQTIAPEIQTQIIYNY